MIKIDDAKEIQMGVLISEMKEGQKVSGVLLVRSKTLATTRAGKPFLTLKMGDRSGEMEAKVWDKADKVSQEFSKGDFVQVSGLVNEYNGKLQMNLQAVQRVDESKIDPLDFLPSSKRDPDEMMAELTACIKKVKDPHYQKLLKSIFQDKTFKNKLRNAPAAKGMHHAYLGGLLEHVLTLFQMCESLAPHFPEIDRDLLRTGVLLHDMGKVDELTYAKNLDYSDQGRLLGHIVLELEMVSRTIRALPDFPEEKEILLKHMLISHHGKEEFGSPVKPMILEALILHMMDDLNAKSQTFRELMGKAQDDRWSSYHPLLGQYVFKGFGKARRVEASASAPNEDKDDPDHPTLF